MTLGPASGKTGSKARSTAKPARRGGRGFRSAAETARKRLGEAASRHGFAEPEVLMRWAEVVGERLSGLCAPVKVSYSRGQGLGATLVVRAGGARAPEVEHLGPRIIERVNQFYGYRAIGRLRVVQTAAPQTAGPDGFSEPRTGYAGAPEPAPAEPGAETKARAAEMTRGVENEALRAALTRVSAHVLSRAGPNEKS